MGARTVAVFWSYLSKGSGGQYELNRHLLVSLAPQTHSLLANNVLFFDSEGDSSILLCVVRDPVLPIYGVRGL